MITTHDPVPDPSVELARMVRPVEVKRMSSDEEIVMLRRQVADLLERVAKLERTYAPLPAPDLSKLVWPMDGSLFRSPARMDKCGCPVGTACCNAACPYAPKVTCSSGIHADGTAFQTFKPVAYPHA